jgi:hypothetical protein
LQPSTIGVVVNPADYLIVNDDRRSGARIVASGFKPSSELIVAAGTE